MNTPPWVYVVLGGIGWQIGKMIYLVLDNYLHERRQKRFLRMVSVMFPDHSKISFIAIDTSNRRAMANLERQVREQFNLQDDEIEDFLEDVEKRRRDR
jgi:hypothetical protein